MASKPVFMRPVEIAGDYASLTIYEYGAGSHTSTIPTGVYSSMAAVLYAFEDRANYDNPALTTHIHFADDGNGEIVVKFTFSNGTGNVFFSSTAVMDFWGSADGSYTNQSTLTLAYRPQYIWLPKYQVANQSRFTKIQNDLFTGTQAKTGQLAGNTTGPDLYYRDLEFHNESAINLFDEAATSVSSPNYSVRNLDYFAQQSRIANPTVSGNPSTKGFWFYPDWNNAIDYPDIIPGGTGGTGTTREGIYFDLASSPDYFAFCQFEDDGFSPPESVEFPTGRIYHNVKFKIHTVSSVPTWEDPDQTGGGG